MVFPAPELPTIATNSPFSTSKLIAFSFSASCKSSKNEKLPKLGSGFTHKKDGPMAKLIKKFTRDFVSGEWDLLNNDVGRYGIPPWH